MSTNAPPPASMPSTSHYRVIEEHIAKPEQFADMDTAAFANQVVSAVLSGASGKVWKGGNTALVKWLVPVMPSFIYVGATPP